MEKGLARIYEFLNQRKGLFWIGLFFVFLILGFLASRIKFEEDISKLLPKGEDTETLTQVLESISFADKTVIILENQDTKTPSGSTKAELEEYADLLIEKLENEASPYIASIQGTTDQDDFFDLLDLVETHLPLFLDSLDYVELKKDLHTDNIRKQVQENAVNVLQQTGIQVNPVSFRQDPFGLIFKGLKKFQTLQGAGNLHIENGYIVTKDRKHLFFFINPLLNATETDQNENFIKLLQANLDTLNQQFQEDQIVGTFFGSTAMAVANADQIKTDIQTTLGIALIVLILLFVYFYRKIYIPLIILLPVIFGSLLGLVVLFWVKGTVSAVSVGIGSVLLGITLDYSLHILSHYRSTGDVLHLYRSTTKALLICAVFTALDFLCLLFLRSEVLQDLGLFSAVSIIGAAFFALIFIPQVYKPGQELQTRNTTWIDKIAAIEYHRKPVLLIFCLGLLLVSIFNYSKVGFDNDLQNLNYQPENLKNSVAKFEELTQSDGQSLYLVAYGDDLNQVLAQNKRIYDRLELLQKQGKVKQFSSIAQVTPSDAEQKQQLQVWKEFWGNQDLALLKEQFQQAALDQGFKRNTYEPFWEYIQSFDALNSLSFFASEPSEQALAPTLFSEWLGRNGKLITILNTIKVAPEEASYIRSAFENEAGVVSIDRKQVQEEFLHNLEVDFDNLIWITSILMFVVIFIFFGNLELTLITNIPVMLGWFVTLGLMGLFGVNFNAFNIIIATLVFGLGIDYAIFITKALMERYTYGVQDLSAYRTGILMSAMATLLCFGILIFAKHPAIHSIAVIPLIGLAVVVFMSFTVQPFLFDFYIQKPQNNGNTPRTIWNIAWTIYTFGYFFGGGFLLSVFSQIYIAVWPSSKKTKFAFFHKAMQMFFKTLMYSTPNCKITIRGAVPDHFKKPVILITNHTSQLDTPTVGMLHNKMIFVVNERVLNSKFFGRSLRMAGFYSTDEQNQAIMDGQESTKILALKQKIEQGYSIIIFPEGTRSRTAEIGRFRKGAFLLAEQLNVDILPVMVHGNTDLLPKNDNILKPGNLTISYLPSISMQDQQWGSNYRERTKQVSRHFKESFRELRRELEGPEYFWTKLKFNFTYKDKSIRKAVKHIFETRRQSYHSVFPLISHDAKIVHLNSQFGIIDFLLAYDGPSRQILALESTVTNRKICANTYSVNRYQLKFEQEDNAFVSKALTMEADVLILTGTNLDFAYKLWDDTSFGKNIQTIILERMNQEFANPDFLSDFDFVCEESFIKVYKRKNV